jgi:hypothetical protein
LEAYSVFQWSETAINRELAKAYCGFSLRYDLNIFPTIATGNWGCGVFLGSHKLKFLIQWIAASRSGVSMTYYSFKNKELADLPEFIADIKLRKMTVGDVAKVLLEAAQEIDQMQGEKSKKFTDGSFLWQRLLGNNAPIPKELFESSTS